MAIATFHPQAWANDYAIDVDPEGPTTFEVEDEHIGLEADTDESDELRDHPNAPAWVRYWSGPFYVSVEAED